MLVLTIYYPHFNHHQQPFNCQSVWFRCDRNAVCAWLRCGRKAVGGHIFDHNLMKINFFDIPVASEMTGDGSVVTNSLSSFTRLALESRGMAMSGWSVDKLAIC